MARLEERRWGGMEYLARRLDEQDLLRPDVTVEEAADVLWVLASFASFDALYTDEACRPTRWPASSPRPPSARSAAEQSPRRRPGVVTRRKVGA